MKPIGTPAADQVRASKSGQHFASVGPESRPGFSTGEAGFPLEFGRNGS
ncbi:hypothetical protein EKH55_0238 [Sinorhizobium alkalisoli]|nr:hypothetical protein EKH55_0238 [Sinorhizobium alkalisoli]